MHKHLHFNVLYSFAEQLPGEVELSRIGHSDHY